MSFQPDRATICSESPRVLTIYNCTLYAVLVAWSSGLERNFVTGAFCLEKLLDFGIVLVKPVFVLPRGEAAYFLRSFLENGFQLLPMVLWICFPDWQFLLFLSGLKLLFKLTFPRQVPVGVKLLHLYPSFPHCRLDIESDFGPAQFVVCVAVGTGHNSGM